MAFRLTQKFLQTNGFFSQKSTQHHEENKETKSTLKKERIPSSELRNVSVFSLYLQLWDEKWKLHQLWIDLTNCPLQNLHKRNGGKYSFIRLLLLYSLFTFSATRSTFTKVWNHQKCLISIFMPKIQTLKYLMMAWKLLLIWKWTLQNETFLIDFQTVWVLLLTGFAFKDHS